MSITMYAASVPVFVQFLKGLSAVLDKAEAHCAAKKSDPLALTGSRLIADMFPLARQVQIATDFAKGVTARLAGVDVPSWEDTEKSIPELKARIAKTIVYIDSFKPAQIDALYFTGGSTGLRLLAQRIAAAFPAARALRGDRFASVASGLGLDAVRRFGQPVAAVSAAA